MKNQTTPEPGTCICNPKPTRKVVCGGDIPWYTHSKADPQEDNNNVPNIYFYADLEGNSLRETVDPLPFALSDEDWAEMEDHANNSGCFPDGRCEICRELC